MTTETFALLSFIACLALGAGCVTLFVLWVYEGREVEDLRKSKDDLRESMSNTNYYLQKQLERVKKENEALRTQLHQLRNEQQKQDNQIHKALTKEQKEVLTAWYKNLLSTYRIDFFRGVVLVRVVMYLCDGGSHRLMRAIGMCQEAERLGFEASSEDYIDLLASLNQITKEVPLSDEAESAITYVFGGEWEEAIEALEKLRSERNEQN